MNTLNKKARLAGLIYLILVLGGIINLVYIPSHLIDWDNAVKTVENINGQETLFRLWIVTGIITFLTFMFLVLALYRLLHNVNKSFAMLMVILVLVSVPISFVNILHNFSILSLIGEKAYLADLGNEAIQNQIMLHLDSYRNGLKFSQIFWGLWLFPFGYLVYKSNFLPKLLGVALMAGCFGYLITFFGGFLYADFNKTILAEIAGIPAPIGEIGICLWLLIMGTNKINWNRVKGLKE
ncbi:protein of unknown function [Spirosomataceae bacterium TFI 002]|nr:protein of unknown function [Spirosomataceae bacterium TFI 002]